VCVFVRGEPGGRDIMVQRQLLAPFQVTKMRHWYENPLWPNTAYKAS